MATQTFSSLPYAAWRASARGQERLASRSRPRTPCMGSRAGTRLWRPSYGGARRPPAHQGPFQPPRHHHGTASCCGGAEVHRKGAPGCPTRVFEGQMFLDGSGSRHITPAPNRAGWGAALYGAQGEFRCTVSEQFSSPSPRTPQAVEFFAFACMGQSLAGALHPAQRLPQLDPPAGEAVESSGVAR